MPMAEAANPRFSPKSASSKAARRKRRSGPLFAGYLLLGSLCGCSVLSSVALETKDFLKTGASATKDVLQSKTLHYLGDSELNYYKDVATKVDYTQVRGDEDNRAVNTEPPRRIRHPREDEIMDITLAEAIQRALSNSEIIRSRGQFLSPSNPILTSPQQANSVFNPGIQSTGITYGNRGLEAALSDYDPNLTFNSTWGRNEQIQNNRFTGNGLPPGATLSQETNQTTAQIQKQLAQGGLFSVSHNINYTLNNVPQFQRLFGSFYTGNVQAQFRQPLLAGYGVEYNRIAGPLSNNPTRVSGVNQGVVIARINNDISIADFESSVRNLLKDVEDLYWDLSLAYRAYDAEIVARNSNLEVWKKTKVKVDLEGKLTMSDQAQAEEAYFESRSRAEEALGRIYSTETELRRLMGLPVNDGFILRPVDEPATAEFIPDWHISLAEALTGRVELRRQKWTIKSLELQLKAARTLVRPRLDFVSGYQVNMFGDKLWAPSDNDKEHTAEGLNSAYGTLTQGNQTGWTLGFQAAMPIGFRSAHSQVRNLELQLAKARKLLSVQELEISHELARAFQDLDRTYQVAQTNFNRRRAAERRVQSEQTKVTLGLGDDKGRNTVDLLLRSQISLAQSSVAYYSSLVAYNQAIVSVHYRKGSLLAFNNVALAEGAWDPQAYMLALRRAWSRSHAIDAGHLQRTIPPEFVTEPEQIAPLLPPEKLPLLMNGEPSSAAVPTPIPEAEPALVPQPEPAPQNGEVPPLIVPPPAPPAPESSDSGWRKHGDQATVPDATFEKPSTSAQTMRRPELPLR